MRHSLAAPLFENGGEPFDESGEKGVGEFESPEDFDERGGIGGINGPSAIQDARELREDVGADTAGAFNDGDVGIHDGRNNHGAENGNGAEGNVKFALAVAHAIIAAPRRAGTTGNATEKIGLGLEEKMDEQAESS